MVWNFSASQYYWYDLKKTKDRSSYCALNQQMRQTFDSVPDYSIFATFSVIITCYNRPIAGFIIGNFYFFWAHTSFLLTIHTFNTFIILIHIIYYTNKNHMNGMLSAMSELGHVDTKVEDVKKRLLPVTLLGGFLGAGKTTLIMKHIIETKQKEGGKPFKCAIISKCNNNAATTTAAAAATTTTTTTTTTTNTQVFIIIVITTTTTSERHGGTQRRQRSHRSVRHSPIG